MSDNLKNRITGIGNTLVDLLINESDQFLIGLNKEKGGMHLVEYEDVKTILAQTTQTPVVATGGSACNTIVGVGNLGGSARFIGSRGNDDYGDRFETGLIQSGVSPRMAVGKMPTGRVLSVVTPDAQRSMFTYLGASVELDPDSIVPDMFKGSGIVVVEGYLLFNEELILAALKAAKSADALIALDLSSFEVVNAAKPILGDLIRNFVDILIANEDEARAYTGIDCEKKAIDLLSKDVSYAVLKVGERGSYVSHDQKITRIEPVKGKPPVDTTGAGDLWASGFLYGLAHGLTIEKAGHLASVCGYEVCRVMGAQLSEKTWARIRSLL